jgi:nicotinamidase-related amidase
MEDLSCIEQSQSFLAYIDKWLAELPVASLSDIAEDPAQVAIISVDVINGFCHEGPLASPRVKDIIAPIVQLFNNAWDIGVRNIILTQDSHEPDAVEFSQFPPHCIRGTSEAETVPEFKALPFFEAIETIEKNSIHSGLNTGFNAWVDAHPLIDRYLIVGDCTDLCTYQLAMHLRLDANARQRHRRVILPVDCVDTYDLPLEVAEEIGAIPHNAELLHRVFLYSMMLNGVELVASVR